MYVSFSKAYTANGAFPSGVTEFDAGGSNEDGLFTLVCGDDNSGEAVGKVGFDFASVDVASDANFVNCHFGISRRLDEWDTSHPPEQLAEGRLDIIDGTLKFGENEWFVGGLADGTYLPASADLKLSTSGQIFGTLPYFHMFVNADHPEAPPPVMATLSRLVPPRRQFPQWGEHFPGIVRGADGADNCGSL